MTGRAFAGKVGMKASPASKVKSGTMGEALGLSQEHWKRGKGIYLDKSRNIFVQPDYPAGNRVPGGKNRVPYSSATHSTRRSRWTSGATSLISDTPMSIRCWLTAARRVSLTGYSPTPRGKGNRYKIECEGKTIEVRSLDLAGTPGDILGQVDLFAEAISSRARGPMHVQAA